MGCGSSSTSVQTFKNPEENTNYNRQPKAPSRKTSATSNRSKRSSEQKFTERKSSASSVLSDGSRRLAKTHDDSRVNSASTKKTYTIQRPNSDINNVPVAPHDENENIESKLETPIEDFENPEIDRDAEKRRLEAQQHHDAIQKQTFLTGDPEEEPVRDSRTREEKHEDIAKRKVEIRAQYNPHAIDDSIMDEYGFQPLKIPDMNQPEPNTNYTIDDMEAHNAERSGRDWFKYGKKIYSWEKMTDILKERSNKHADLFSNCDPYSDLFIHTPRITKPTFVSRKEMARLLPVCCVGNCVDVPRDDYLARMKQSAEAVLEEDTGSEYFLDYKGQLERWLANYPLNKVYNDTPDPNTDPNGIGFPLPADIQSDPSVLMKWIESWTPFDCDIPEEGAWTSLPLINDDWGDVHDTFAKQVQINHDDSSLEPFDMAIDGDVAWVELELELIKNDKATNDQEVIWKKRAKRTNLNDPEWMKQRRVELGNALKQRYEQMQISYPVENYVNFADVLENHWREFQALCEKEFTIPQGNFKIKKQPNLSEGHVEIDGGDIVEVVSVENRLVIGCDSEPNNIGHDDQNVKSQIDGNSRPVSSNENQDQLDLGSAEESQVLNLHEENENEGGGNRLIFSRETDVSDKPAFETTDSGLELDSAERQSSVGRNVDDKDNTNEQRKGGKSDNEEDDNFY